MCANGKKQRRFAVDTDDWSSPTASLESILTTFLIDVVEGRSVATVDIPGAYLHAEFPADKNVLLKITGELVDLMCDIDPTYSQEVCWEGNCKVLYVKVIRALYGCLESARLWYDLYSKELVSMGFTLNPYDPCVANKVINGDTCTVVFYVDDNKISHKDPEVVQQVIDQLSKKFGKLTVNKVKPNKPFDFLGMNVTLREDKKFEIEMKDQLREAISWFGEEITIKPTSPAGRNLFVVDEESELLDDEKSETFHSTVAKLLYISQRARPDIEVTASFLCRRVSCSTMSDWKKLERVLGYLQNTIDDIRVVGAKDLQDLYTWIDAAYAVHDNYRSQTGGCMSFGHGLVHHKSLIQKLNTKSSTEAELVGTSNYVPYNVWVRNFLSKQGYDINDNVLVQDNQSAIKMENNGRNSCSGKSRHINIRHFL